MEQLQKVDVSIVEILDELIKKCKETERFWIVNENLPIDTSLLIVSLNTKFSSRTGKMKNRFVMAAKRVKAPTLSLTL